MRSQSGIFLFIKREGESLSNIFIYMNNVFTTVGNQAKKNLAFLKEMSEDFFRYTHAEWS